MEASQRERLGRSVEGPDAGTLQRGLHLLRRKNLVRRWTASECGGPQSHLRDLRVESDQGSGELRMTIGGLQMQIHAARRETEEALRAALDLDIRKDGRGVALIAEATKWLANAVTQLEMARKEVLSYEVEGGKK